MLTLRYYLTFNFLAQKRFLYLVISPLSLIISLSINPAICSASQSRLNKINRIQAEISNQKAKIKSSENQQIDLYKELNKIDNELKVGQHKLRFLQERLLKQENHIQQKEDEIILINAEKDNLGKHVEKRLKSFYQTDEISFINTLFSTSTLPEMLNFKEYFQSMLLYDKNILQKFSLKISLLAGAHKVILKEKDKLLGIIVETKKQEKSLIAAHQQKTDLFARVLTEEKLYRYALKETQIAANKLAEKITNLNTRVIRSKKRKISVVNSSKKSRPTRKIGFSAAQGKLPPPVPGRISRHFGTYVDKFNTEITSSGIDIDTNDKTEVKCIFPGIVVFEGTMDGFGNMIIIDHDMQYHSLVSGLDSTLVKKGDQVTTGQIIGITGNGATLLSKGLHFEIRHESHPVDPLLWLDTTELITSGIIYNY